MDSGGFCGGKRCRNVSGGVRVKGTEAVFFSEKMAGRFGSGSSIKTAIVKAWLTPKAV